MPTFEEHRQKCDSAKSAQLARQAADPNEHADWIVITTFYQALHWHQDKPDPASFFNLCCVLLQNAVYLRHTSIILNGKRVRYYAFSKWL